MEKSAYSHAYGPVTEGAARVTSMEEMGDFPAVSGEIVVNPCQFVCRKSDGPVFGPDFL